MLFACETPPVDDYTYDAGFEDDGGFGSAADDGMDYGSSGFGASSGELAAGVGDTVNFVVNSSSLNAESRSVLAGQAEWLKSHPDVSVVIEGHCDERGTREYNLALGERRANAVKQFLVRSGVNSARVATISYGKERPAVEGSSNDAWARNRRAVTLVR